MTKADDPGRSVRRAASSPAVHDSAVAIAPPREQLHHLVVDARAVLGEDLAPVALAQQRDELLVHGRAPGSKRVTISISPRRRQVVISSSS